jgi:lipooligosaccharide transport system permease protein
MATPTSVRAFEYYLTVYKRTWRGTAITSFLTPVLFLAAMGLGLGTLVNDSSTVGLGGVEYVVFLAPGLLASTAMQTATFESAWPVVGALKWMRTYYAQAATPLSPADIAFGHFFFVTLRVLLASCAFFVVMALFGAVTSWTAVFAIPAAVLTGLAFATPVTAFSISRESEQGLSAMFRFVIIPMFLFSGTFFPVTQLPVGIRWIAYVTPLWHGVVLCRGLALGELSFLGALGHTAVLVAYVLAGGFVAITFYRRRLSA